GRGRTLATSPPRCKADRPVPIPLLSRSIVPIAGLSAPICGLSALKLTLLRPIPAYSSLFPLTPVIPACPPSPASCTQVHRRGAHDGCLNVLPAPRRNLVSRSHPVPLALTGRVLRFDSLRVGTLYSERYPPSDCPATAEPGVRSQGE